MISWWTYCLINPLIEYGLSSNQIRTNDIRNVVLLVVFPRTYTIIFFGLTNAITWSHNYGIPSSWKPGWIVVESISNTATFSMTRVEHPASIGNFISIIFVFRSWSICWMKEVTYSNSCALDASCRREFEKVCFASSGIIPSQSCIRAKYSVVRRLATFVLYVFLAHQATDWFVLGEGVLFKS